VSAVLNFYTLPEIIGITFNLLTIVSAGFTAWALILHQYRFKHDFNYWLNSAAYFLAVCQTLINAALIAQVQVNVTDGYIVPSGYIVMRYAVFIAATALLIFILLKDPPALTKKALLPAIVAAASFLTLPVLEAWTGRAFPAAYSLSLMILLVSSIWLTVKIHRELRSSISNLSVKQALDSLDTAVLFYRKSGHILMQNEKMQELMQKTAGRVFFNGKLYLEKIRNEELGTRNEFIVRVADTVTPHSSLLTPHSHEREWLFAARKIRAGRIAVTQLTATDVTEQNRENRLLREKHRELEQRQKQLKAFIKNIEESCRLENLLRIRTELHDTHNAKLTTLLQYLRYGQLPQNESFDALSASVLRGIKEPVAAPADPQAMLDGLIGNYGRKGVQISLSANLPPTPDTALALAQILQEAAANAVTHGYANEVCADITDGGGYTAMRVTDNSTLPLYEITEGSGIAGMRLRAEKLGGSLSIDTSPRFTLTVNIPKGSEELGMRN
jgi:signal transduction histidine kinase